ncbi:MAG: hypothetical protein ACI9U1_001983 [Porticoccaceae bacterium]|jgi:hypothetical protein
MSKSYEVQGLVHSIGETKEFGANGFTKREFVLKVTGAEENPSYPNYLSLELIKDKCLIIDSYGIGDEITVQLNLSGRLWTPEGQPEKCFNSLQAWKIESFGEGENNSEPAPYQPIPDSNEDFDDIPF